MAEAHAKPEVKKDAPKPEKKSALSSVTATGWAIISVCFMVAVGLMFGAEMISLMWNGIISTIQNFFNGSITATDSTRIGLHSLNIVLPALNIELGITTQNVNSTIMKAITALLVPVIIYYVIKEIRKEKGGSDHH